MLTNLNCYLNQVFCPPICFCPLRNRGGEESRRYKILTIFGPLLYIFDRFGPFWVYVCPFGQGKLLNRSRLDSSSRGFLIGCVLIPPPLGFLTTFLYKIWNFQKVFIWILNWNLLNCFGHAKWQIQGGFIIVPLPYWTGRVSKQAASWFLPPLACLGLRGGFCPLEVTPFT